jgi:CBS domain-containing protein
MAAAGAARSVASMTTTSSTDLAGPLAAVSAGAAMHPGVLTVAPTASMDSVARTMVAQAVHAVLVRPDDPRRLGWPSRVVTDRDVVGWAVAGGSPNITAVDAASEPAGVLGPDQPLVDAARIMVELGETHVLVAHRASRLPEGVLSSFDLTAVVGGREPRAAGLVRPGPARPARSERSLDRIAARDAMHGGVIACAPDTSLTDVAASMADHRVHCVVVAGVRNERLVWKTIDTMDIARAALRWDPSLTAADVARDIPVAIDDADTMLDAARAMVEAPAAHVIVVDRAGAPAGVVSSLDVATVCATG